MNLEQIYSLMFFAIFCISLALGVNILYINPKEKLNRHFYFLSISLCFWALGFAISNMSINMEHALLWRRVSAVGRTTIHAFLLHMILLITGKEEKLKKWMIILIYVPAIISMYVYSISTNMSLSQYHLIKTNVGWVNVSVNNFWGISFNIYYIFYMFVNFFLISRWKMKEINKNTKKQADILLVSFIITLALGVVTDVLLNALFKSKIPQLGPLLSLIPLLAIFYLTKNNNLMREKISEEWDKILSSENRVKIYFLTSVLFLVGGTLNSLQYFFPQLMNNQEGIQLSLPVSICLFSVGTLILIFQFIKDDKIRDILILLATILSIPIITLSYIKTSSITVWVFPLILMVMSLVFDTTIPITLITIVSVITQVIVWKYSTTQVIIMDEIDFLLRVGMFLITYQIGVIVNRIYIKKLKENTNHANIQKIISEISFDLIDINKDNLEKHINKLLSRIGKFFNIDRTYIFTINNEKNTMTYSFEWCSKNAEPEIGTIEDAPLEVFSWWIKELKDNNIVLIKDVEDLPEEASEEKEQLQRQNIKSTLAIPIEEAGEIIGFIGCDSTTTLKNWSEDKIELLKTMANMLSSILMKVKTEKEIEFLAYYDHLTGLPNRLLFKDRATQALKFAKRIEKLVAIIFVDLDSFKMINDTMGHSGGDNLLKDIAIELKNCVRDTDTVARFGGDEFLVMLNNMSSQEDIIIIATKIMDIFKKPFYIREHEFFVTASAGIAISVIDGEDIETLIKNADIAMYEAKEKGKNQFILCTKDMKEDLQRNMTLSNHLFRAIERNELIVYYQPQIQIQEEKITGLEALLRWKHPEYGMIPPNVFIPLAEKSGVINTIGEWVLRTAWNQNNVWHKKGLFNGKIAVNLSTIQFNDIHLVEKIKSIINEVQLDPSYLELEITESIAVKESAYIIEVLNSLRKLGVSISIDDFGTEYSSLSRLKMLPVDKIKIDMQFIQGIDGNQKDQAITKVIINLAKSLNLEVIAEGVETITQLEFLNQRMCDNAQGYYYYKPMPAQELEEVFKNKDLNKKSAI